MSANTPFGTTSGSDFGTTGTTGRTGTTGTTGGSMGSPGTTSAAGTGTATGAAFCEHCGAPLNKGLEQFLGRLGINEEMINNLKSSLQNIDVEQYVTTARDYLKDGTNKATSYTKENPGKVAAGVSVLAVGIGLLIAAMNRDK